MGLRITVTVDGNVLVYAQRLQRLSTQVERAEREGLQEGGNLTRTGVRKSLREQMGTKTTGPITRSTSGGLSGPKAYTIKGWGKGLPIRDFPVRGGRTMHGNWRDQPRNSAGRWGPLQIKGSVTAEPWRVSHQFWQSFRLGGEFVARRQDGRIQKLYGPSVPKELTKDQTAAYFEGTAAQLVSQAVFKRIGRLL